MMYVSVMGLSLIDTLVSILLAESPDPEEFVVPCCEECLGWETHHTRDRRLSETHHGSRFNPQTHN